MTTLLSGYPSWPPSDARANRSRPVAWHWCCDSCRLPERLLLVIDDSPTKRYGPKVEGADVHHNPTPGPADQPFLYGHIWVTISLALRHPLWGPLALPLRAMLYVRQQTMATIPKCRRWPRFATKLQLAARLVEWIVPLLKKAGKTVWVVVDGGYTKRPFLRRVLKLGRSWSSAGCAKTRRCATCRRKFKHGPASRSRPAAQVWQEQDQPGQACRPQRGWQTVECTVYGKAVTKTYKTFLATYRPVGGVIRVVLVKEDHGWYAFFCTDPNASVRGDSRSVRRPGDDRTGLSRREGSLGQRASSKCATSGPTWPCTI